MSAWGDYTYFLRDAERGISWNGWTGASSWAGGEPPVAGLARSVGEWTSGPASRPGWTAWAPPRSSPPRTGPGSSRSCGPGGPISTGPVRPGATSLGAGWRASLGWRLDAQSNHVDDTAPGTRGTGPAPS